MSSSISNSAATTDPSPSRLFAVRFFAFLVAASLIIWAADLPHHLGPVQHVLAHGAQSIARITGGSSTVVADQIHAGGMRIDVTFECTGVYVLTILFVFLFAYPAPWSRRLAGAFLGTVLLSFVNLLRIAFLVRIAELHPTAFGLLHEYVWQGVFLVLVIGYAITWTDYTRA